MAENATKVTEGLTQMSIIFFDQVIITSEDETTSRVID
jgi:hypothetical protein